MKRLPAGWTMTTLGTICSEMRNGLSTKPTEQAGLPILRISAVRPMKLEITDVRYLPEGSAEIRSYVLHEGDLLFTRYNGSRDLVAACARVGRIDSDLVYPDKLIRVRIDPRLALPSFVERAASSDQARSFIDQQLKTSAGQVGISGADLKRLPIPMAPIAEQKRISDKLDIVLTRVDAVNTRLARVPTLLKRFRQSVLAAGYTGRLTQELRAAGAMSAIEDSVRSVGVLPRPNRYASRTDAVIAGDYALAVNEAAMPIPDGWRWVPLVDVARMESGHTPSRSEASYWGGNVPWIGIADARIHHTATINETLQHTNDLGLANSAARLLPTGTVCVSRTASVGYVVKMGRPMATSQDFVNWTCTAAVNADWLKWLFVAEGDALPRFGKGSTHTTIYFPEWLSMQVALPPVEEQAEIVRRVETLFAFADRLEARLQTAQTAANRLTPSLLAKAFRGELVPQDPNDEPASELLKRLATASAQSPARKLRAKGTK